MNERRKFLKKIAYVAPVIVGLGVLSQPTNSSAKSPNSKANDRAKSRVGRFKK